MEAALRNFLDVVSYLGNRFFMIVGKVLYIGNSTWWQIKVYNVLYLYDMFSFQKGGAYTHHVNP